MKKLLCLLITLLITFRFIYTAEEIKITELNTFNNIETDIGQTFHVDKTYYTTDPDIVYAALLAAAQEHNANIFRSSSSTTDTGEPELLKYILLTADTRFFTPFKLMEGSVLTPAQTQDMDNVSYLSSHSETDERQVGILQSAIDTGIRMKPLHTSLTHMRPYGTYSAELPEGSDLTSFLETFRKNLLSALDKDSDDVSTEDLFQLNPEETDLLPDASGYYQYMLYTLTGVTMLAFLYYMADNSKRTGIYKIHGLSFFRMYQDFILREFGMWYLISFAAIFCIQLILKTPAPLSQIFYDQLLLCAALFILTAVLTFLHMKLLTIVQAVKNNKHTTLVLYINLLVKFICIIILFSSLWSTGTEFRQLMLKKESYGKWAESNEFGTIPVVDTGHSEGDFSTEALINKDLYPVLNKMGALYIKAFTHSPDFLEWNDIEDDPMYRYLPVTVNPNYLNRYPVYDTDGTPVTIKESETDWIVLVPESYKNAEEDLLECIKADRDFYYDLTENIYELTIPEEVKNQPVRIIWTAPDQELFSFHPEVSLEKQNYIKDPIVMVVTESNSCYSDRECFLGQESADPLKVKLSNYSTTDTYASLYPILQEMNLDDTLPHIVSLNESAMSDLEQIRQALGLNIALSILSLFLLIFMEIQQISITYEKTKQQINVMKLSGIPMLRIYRNTFFALTGFWLAGLMTILLLTEVPALFIIPAGILLLLLETYIFMTGHNLLDKKNRIHILKGA